MTFSIVTSSAPNSLPACLTISCEDCAMRDSSACDECVVSVLWDEDPSAPVVIDAPEARAVRMLARAGLAPPLRHQPRSHCA